MWARTLRCSGPAIAGLAWILGCGEAPDTTPGDAPETRDPTATAAHDEGSSPYAPGARPDVVENLRETAVHERHASDGGGRGWIESTNPNELRVGVSARITLGFEVGPEGIAEGGTIFLQGPPFWGWTPPQTHAPELPGYTTVEVEGEGVELVPETVANQQVVVFEVSPSEKALPLRLHALQVFLVPGDELVFEDGAVNRGSTASVLEAEVLRIEAAEEWGAYRSIEPR